jgi:hypothetical protein
MPETHAGWLKAEMEKAHTEVMSWPAWKRDAMRAEVVRVQAVQFRRPASDQTSV